MAQLPFIVKLRHSSIWQTGVRGLHAVLMLEIMLVPWDGALRLAMLAVLLVSAFRCEKAKTNPLPLTMRLGRKGDIWLRIDPEKDFIPAQLHSRALVHPWLTVFHLSWRDAGLAKDQTRLIWVLPDSASAEDFRRLRVWLNWECPNTAIAVPTNT